MNNYSSYHKWTSTWKVLLICFRNLSRKPCRAFSSLCFPNHSSKLFSSVFLHHILSEALTFTLKDKFLCVSFPLWALMLPGEEPESDPRRPQVALVRLSPLSSDFYRTHWSPLLTFPPFKFLLHPRAERVQTLSLLNVKFLK